MSEWPKVIKIVRDNQPIKRKEVIQKAKGKVTERTVYQNLNAAEEDGLLEQKNGKYFFPDFKYNMREAIEKLRKKFLGTPTPEEVLWELGKISTEENKEEVKKLIKELKLEEPTEDYLRERRYTAFQILKCCALMENIWHTENGERVYHPSPQIDQFIRRTKAPPKDEKVKKFIKEYKRSFPELIPKIKKIKKIKKGILEVKVSFPELIWEEVNFQTKKFLVGSTNHFGQKPISGKTYSGPLTDKSVKRWLMRNHLFELFDLKKPKISLEERNRKYAEKRKKKLEKTARKLGIETEGKNWVELRDEIIERRSNQK